MGFMLNDVQALGSKVVILLWVSDYFQWEGNQKGARLGTTYSVLSLVSGSEPSVVKVKVPDKEPIVDQKMIAEYNAKKKFMSISFQNLQGRPYSDRNGRIMLACRASEVQLEPNEIDF